MKECKRKNAIIGLFLALLILSPGRTLAADLHLTPGHHEKWIDRIQLPEYARSFYDSLVEASDNDGQDDWLIDVIQGEMVEDKYCVTLTTFKGTAEDEEDMNDCIERKIDQLEMEVRAAYDAFNRDHPEVFWLSGQTASFYSGVTYFNYYYKITYYFTLQADDFDIREEEYRNAGVIRTEIAHCQNILEEILQQAPGNPEEEVRYFNHWLTLHNGYNTDRIAGQEAPAASSKSFCALQGNHGARGPVCEGYARAFKVLCDNAGIPCCLVDGVATSSDGSSGSHMWNLVQIENEWYAVDVTYNDPLVNGEDQDGISDYLFLRPESIVNDIPFSQSHQVKNQPSKESIEFLNQPE